MEAISDAFIRQSEAFADRSELWIEPNILNRNLRGIVFARNNAVFRKNHKLCLVILKEFGFGVKSISETRILQKIKSLSEEILKFNGQPFNPKPLTISSIFSVIASILFGKTSSNYHRDIARYVNEFVNHIEFAIDFVPLLRFLPNFRRRISVLAQCHRNILKAIEEGIECSKSNEHESTFVRRFIEIQGTDYDHQDLLYVVRDLCFGSAHSVSTTLHWALVELANHPEIQTRFQGELDDVIPEDRFPSLDDKPLLPLTEAVILEVMRRRSLTPFFAPRVALKDTEVLGYYLPKGCMILPNVLLAHMDKKSWKDPGNFRPDRFLDEDNTVIGREKVIAFGLGKRSCLGEILGRQEIFLFLTSLVQRFDIRPPEGQDSIRVKEIIGGTMHPSEFVVRLMPRRKIKN